MGNPKKIMLFVFSGFLLRTACVFSQDIHFSQFYTSPVLLNPAAAGASIGDFRFVVNYKSQWKSVISPFKTMAIAFDSKVYTSKKRKGNHFGYGFTIFNDKAGLSKLTTNQANLDLSYHVYVSRNSSISAGVSAGFFQKSINTSNLKWDAQYDGKNYDASLPTSENGVYQSFMKFDLSAGMMYHYYNRDNNYRLELGGSLSHITKPKISFYSQDPSLNFKYIGHMLMQLKMTETVFFIPSAMYALQGRHTEVIAGANVKFMIGEQTREKVILNTFSKISSGIQFGAFYRLKDAVIFTAAIDYKRSMTFGVSYDVNVSKLNQASKWRGGLEFSFILIQQKKSKLRTKY